MVPLKLRKQLESRWVKDSAHLRQSGRRPPSNEKTTWMGTLEGIVAVAAFAAPQLAAGRSRWTLEVLPAASPRLCPMLKDRLAALPQKWAKAFS